jgi:TetR/AcrR family transcriptional repressor of nem operon
MPYSAAHRRKVRERIVDSARRLFNRHGFDSVSIQQLMAGAQLTHGSFYSYFASKNDLYAEVLACFFTKPEWKNCWQGIHIDMTAAAVGPQIIRAYLSRQHFEDVENCCPMVALPSDVARSGKSAQSAFQGVFKAMVNVLERGSSGSEQSRRTAAQAVAALCIGGMVVARAITDRALADELRASCMAAALRMGGGRRRGPRRASPLRATLRRLPARHARRDAQLAARVTTSAESTEGYRYKILIIKKLIDPPRSNRYARTAANPITFHSLLQRMRNPLRYPLGLRVAGALCLLFGTAAPAEHSDLIARGAYLAAAGECVVCHTSSGAKPLAGGYPLDTGFGTVYSTNITPHKSTGIGNWTADEFYRALHEGIAANQQRLYPAFP